MTDDPALPGIDSATASRLAFVLRTLDETAGTVFDGAVTINGCVFDVHYPDSGGGHVAYHRHEGTG